MAVRAHIAKLEGGRMRPVTRVLSIVLGWVLVAAIFHEGDAAAAPSLAPPSRQRGLTVVSISLPENAVLLGIGWVVPLKPSGAVNINYTLTIPKNSSVKLHQFGLGLGIGLLSARQGFPLDIMPIGTANFMIGSGLPEKVSTNGYGYVIGVTIGKSLSVGNNIRIGATYTPLWTSSSSTLSVRGSGSDKQGSSKGLHNTTLSLMIHDLISLTPGVTFGKNLWNPGVALMIRNSVQLGADVAFIDDKKIPSFSVGWKTMFD